MDLSSISFVQHAALHLKSGWHILHAEYDLSWCMNMHDSGSEGAFAGTSGSHPCCISAMMCSGCRSFC